MGEKVELDLSRALRETTEKKVLKKLPNWGERTPTGVIASFNRGDGRGRSQNGGLTFEEGEEGLKKKKGNSLEEKARKKGGGGWVYLLRRRP